VPHRLIPGPTPQAVTSHQVKNPLPLSPVTPLGVARFEAGALGCSVEGASGNAAAGFAASVVGTTPAAGSPLWARTVRAGADI
jgi:hypothetical protein